MERGVLGSVGLLLLLLGLAVRTSSFAGARLRNGFAAVVVKPNALLGALAGTIVTGTVYELLHVRHVWTLFAFIAALYTWGRE
jgi:hypothetical protein